MRTAAFLLSLALIFSIPCESIIVIGGPTDHYGLITRVFGVLLAMAWLITIPKFGSRKSHPFHMAIFLFILWNVASFFWSVDVDKTVHHIKTYVQLAILAWILWDLYTTPKAVRAALEAYILGAYVAIGDTIYNFSTGQIISEYEIGRYTGAGINAVDLTVILVLGLPVAWHLATSAGNGIKDNFLRLINFAYIPASLCAIILTGSRTSIFIVVPAILYILGTANRLKPLIRILIFAVFLGSLVAVQHYIPASTMERLATAGKTIAERDFGGRMGIWRKSIAIFSEHPVLGIGSGALSSTSAIGDVAHNTFLSVLAELGLIGFGLFVFMLAIVLYQTVNQPKQLSGLWLTVLAILAMSVCTLTWEYRKPIWLFLSLIVISANLFKERNSIIETEPLSVCQFN